eukprot:2103267-Rhodomonas_salina.2
MKARAGDDHGAMKADRTICDQRNPPPCPMLFGKVRIQPCKDKLGSEPRFVPAWAAGPTPSFAKHAHSTLDTHTHSACPVAFDRFAILFMPRIPRFL